MNQDTGEVKPEEELEELTAEEQRTWTKFNLGELINIKGIMFYVHEVSDQRLVLKYKNKTDVK